MVGFLMHCQTFANTFFRILTPVFTSEASPVVFLD